VLRDAMLNYFRRAENSHIIYLLSKSRLGFGQRNKKNFCKIQEIYKQLESIPEISTILKAVERSALIFLISGLTLRPLQIRCSCQHKCTFSILS